MHPPFPLVEGDATSLPFADDAFAGAYLRWVLHLIPDWRAAVREIERILAPGSTFIAALGAYGGYRQEMQARFAEITGISTEPAGLAWNGWDELDAEVASLGLQKLPDIGFTDHDRDDLEHFMQAIEGNRFSWTWAVPDAATREDAAAKVRRWAEDRWGPLSEMPPETLRLALRRLPAALTRSTPRRSRRGGRQRRGDRRRRASRPPRGRPARTSRPIRRPGRLRGRGPPRRSRR